MNPKLFIDILRKIRLCTYFESSIIQQSNEAFKVDLQKSLFTYFTGVL